MDPQTLIAPASPLGFPAPYWFLVVFKALGFALHAVPMNVILAGLAVVLILDRFGCGHAQRLARRLARQMPVVVAFAVNLGVVPLLFTQVIYYRVFYPATILMAWPWFAIIGMLTLAYYGVYIYAVGQRHETLTAWKKAAGWGASLLLIGIAFNFSSGFSCMTHLEAWPALWQKANVAGAPTGLTHYVSPDQGARWLMMFGLALTTTVAYLVVDAGWFARPQDSDYQRWLSAFAVKLSTVGVLWFSLAGAWYVFGTWPVELRRFMSNGAQAGLAVLTALSPGLPWLFLVGQARRGRLTRGWTGAVAGAQLGVIGLNVVSRQIVQNWELRRFLDPGAESVTTQWGPLFLFLGLFLVALLVIAWLIRQILRAAPEAGSPAIER